MTELAKAKINGTATPALLAHDVTHDYLRAVDGRIAPSIFSLLMSNRFAAPTTAPSTPHPPYTRPPIYQHPTSPAPVVSAGPQVLNLRATSGREWRLRRLRPLTPNVQLVQDVAYPNGPPLTLKTVLVPDDEAIRIAMDDVSVWRRAAKADPRNILPLFDVVIQRKHMYFISPYCPGGDLCVQCPERDALRHAAAIAAAVETIIGTCGQTAHGNLSPSNIFLDHVAIPKVAGWGATRGRLFSHASTAPTERDDVFAIAAILYAMLYGHDFDFQQRDNSIPDDPPVSDLTKKLLHAILVERCIPDLIVFRYDIAAARGLVPASGPALTPIIDRRRERILDSDLNSNRGFETSTPFALPASSAVTSTPSRGPSPSPTTPTQRQQPLSPPNPPSRESENSVSMSAEPTSSANTAAVDASDLEELVRTATTTELTACNPSVIDNLVESCAGKDDSADRIFKVLFKLPISKNPIVAFKVMTLIHRLVSEAPAKLTTLCVEHDGFLGWVESSWSQERIQNKNGRVHMHTGGFSVGEISWYASLIRKRCSALVNLASAFTAHWMIRPGAMEALSTRRREPFRIVLRVLEGASSILRKAAPARDPTAEVKRAAVPYLVTEVCKLYLMLCWMYCVAPGDHVRSELTNELTAAHSATRNSLVVVRDDDQLVAKCHAATSSFFLMSATVPSSFVKEDIMASLKALQKKKKKRKGNPATSNASLSPMPAPAVGRTPSPPRSPPRPPPLANGSQVDQPSPARSTNTDEEEERYNGANGQPNGRRTTKKRLGRQRDLNGRNMENVASPRTKSVAPVTGKKNGWTSTKMQKPVSQRQSSEEESQEGTRDVPAKAVPARKKSMSQKPVTPAAGKKKNESTATAKAQRQPASPMQSFDDDHPGASKEALAAAAQGRKTPMINPKYEIMPYEVQYGPQIGSGGFGVVYKAKFRNETVAVKKIHAHALSNAASVGEFQSEVAVLCTLNHANILRFVGACTKPPNLMILTEFMSRGTLFDLLHQSQERVTWSMRRKFALDTCRGMQYLHDSKLLHRDLKSSNLMLDRDLNCKVGDFGLTRISRGTAAVQMTGQCGTFQYMAVEVLASKPYSEKADVFSFGILLWEMVARQLPYFGMQPVQVGIAVMQQGLRPTIPQTTPAPVANMMRSCWDNNPDKRPSFAQLVKALESMPE